MSLPRYPEYKDSGVAWLAVIPSNWEVKKLGYLFTEPPCYGVLVPDFEDNGVPMIRIMDMAYGKVNRDALTTISTSLSQQYSRTITKKGDVLLSVVGTIGEVVHVDEQLEGVNLSRAVARIQTNRGLNPYYLGWFLQSAVFTSYVDLVCVGSAQRVLNMGDLSALRAALPSKHEQTAIATFLDRETAKIDALIAEQEKLLTLLAEKRQATISHAVTKGLNPDAPMKDSGVEWLGEVPAHWVISPLARISIERCDGPFGSGIKSEHYTDSGALVVRLQNIRAGLFSTGEPVFLDENYFLVSLRGHEVKPGDLLVAGLGDDNNLLGRACIAPEGLGLALVKADCFRFRLNTRRVVPKFAAWQLSAGAAYDAGVLATGTTRSRISLSVMSSRKLALPPIGEQEAIVAFIAQENEKLDMLKGESERSIDLLKERRTALISAAVTGKIDVRNA